MALVLDAGALIALDKRYRTMRARLEVAATERVPIRTAATAVAQAWRDGARQANLARLLEAVEVLALGPNDARRVGALLAATGTSDVVDAHVASVVETGDEVLTTDPQDIRRLVVARGVTARMLGV